MCEEVSKCAPYLVETERRGAVSCAVQGKSTRFGAEDPGQRILPAETSGLHIGGGGSGGGYEYTGRTYWDAVCVVV